MAWLGGFEGGLAKGVPAGNIEAFKRWLEGQPKMPGLQLIALHNSAAPDIAQTDKTPGGYDQRQRNIAVGYKQKGWRGGPAFNVYPDGTIRGGTPWPLKGVHSPSWNDTGIGIEMMADFSHDDDDAGKGFTEKNTACAMIAAILRHQDLPVSNATIKLHKEDPQTTHDCPGKDVEKYDILARVKAHYDAMGTPGEHVTEVPHSAEVAQPSPKEYTVTVDGLNLRDKGGMLGKVITSLAKGQLVKVWSTSKNAATTWAHVTGVKPGNTVYFDGFVSMSYLQAPLPAPAPTPPAPSAPPPPAPQPQPGTTHPGEEWFQPGSFTYSDFCRDWAKRFEGKMLKAYWDRGNWAIGWGHNTGSGVPPAVTEGMTITEEEAVAILDGDLKLQAHYINAYVKVPLLQRHCDALCLFCFQQGPGNLRKSEVLALVNAGSYDAVEKLLKGWSRNDPGLNRRHQTEGKIWAGERPTKW